jgi:uncharacterized membrane protein YfcA
LIVELVLLCTVGAVSGLVAGIAGLAGGIVIVPVLTWLYGPQALQSAIVVSWFSVFFNSLAASTTQWRSRTKPERGELLFAMRWYLLGTAVVTPFVAVGAVRLTNLIGQEFVGILQLCLAGVMLLPVAEGAHTARPERPLRDASFGGLVGTLSTVIGVGGGAYTIAYFVHGNGSRFRDALAAANLTGLTLGALSVGAYLSSLVLLQQAPGAEASPISTLGLICMVACGLAAAPLGVLAQGKCSVLLLRRLVIVSLIISALRLLLG